MSEAADICHFSYESRESVVCPAMPMDACGCMSGGLDNSIECSWNANNCTKSNYDGGKNFFSKDFQLGCPDFI